jgi:hypothetical protein
MEIPAAAAQRQSHLLENSGLIIAHYGTCPVTFHLPNANRGSQRISDGLGRRPLDSRRRHMAISPLDGGAPSSFVIGGAPPTRTGFQLTRRGSDIQRVAANLGVNFTRYELA